MHRVVIDTNVLISGIIQQSGFPFKVVKLWEDEVVVLVTSVATIEEAERVLNYPKIRKRYALTSDDIQRTVANLLKYYMGKNTPERQEFIIENLRVEEVV